MLHRPTSPTILVSLALVSVLGCDRKAEPGADAKAAGAEASAKAGADAKADAKAGADGKVGADAACDDARSKALRAELAALCPIGDQTLDVEVPLAPWKSGPVSPPFDAVELQVTAKGVVVGWGDPVPEGQLSMRLREEVERAVAFGRPPPGWVLAIAADAPRAEVARALAGLVHSEQKSGHVVFATTDVGTIPPPRDPAVLAKLATMLDELPPDQRSTIMAREIQQSMPPCAPVEKAFGAVAAASVDQRCSLLAVGIAEGLVSCGCPDADQLLTQIYAVTAGTKVPERLAVAVPVTIDPTATSRAGATWGAMVEGIDQTALETLWVAPD